MLTLSSLGFIRGNLTKEQKNEIKDLLETIQPYALSSPAKKRVGKNNWDRKKSRQSTKLKLL